jgi:hypothetical protein
VKSQKKELKSNFIQKSVNCANAIYGFKANVKDRFNSPDVV